MRISGPVRMVVGFFIAIALCIALLKWHPHRNLISRPTPSAGLSSTPHLGGSALPELTSSRPKKDDSSLPPESGHSYHAYELLYHPDRDLGNLIELDPFSVPVLNPTIPDFVTYIKLRPRDAVLAGMVGLRYANDISSNVSVFDVRAEDTAGDFTQGTDIITVGQIAVQISGPNQTPNPLRDWNVEPKGTIEGTTAAGLVVRVPIVRFWRYSDEHAPEVNPRKRPEPSGNGSIAVNLVRSNVKPTKVLLALNPDLQHIEWSAVDDDFACNGCWFVSAHIRKDKDSTDPVEYYESPGWNVNIIQHTIKPDADAEKFYTLTAPASP